MAKRRKNNQKEFEERVIDINRISQKTKGGDKMGFTALVVVGNRKGKVGIAHEKANDVLSAIKKSVRKAKKSLIEVPIEGTTIPHEISLKNGAARLILKPAPEGTGIIAGGAVRNVLEASGIENVVAKVLGTNNQLSNVNTTFLALEKMKEIIETKKELGQLPKKKQEKFTKTKNKKSSESKKSNKSKKKSKK